MNAIELRDALNEKIEQGLGHLQVNLEGCDCFQEARSVELYTTKTLLITNVWNAQTWGEDAWKR